MKDLPKGVTYAWDFAPVVTAGSDNTALRRFEVGFPEEELTDLRRDRAGVTVGRLGCGEHEIGVAETLVVEFTPAVAELAPEQFAESIERNVTHGSDARS